jgi:hypothetical protein
MTDKEQALVAAAYRVAAGKAFYECDRIRMTNLGDVVYEAVISLTPAAAEAKLRAMMMEVAEKAFISGMDWPTTAKDNLEQIVDEVLNERPA